jgi:hypothetical protein
VALPASAVLGYARVFTPVMKFERRYVLTPR